MTRATIAAGFLVALLSGALVLLAPALLAYYSDFRGLSATETARRLTQYHGVACKPVSAVSHDGQLAVICVDSQRVDFYADLPCSESFACGTLGIDAACWRPAGP